MLSLFKSKKEYKDLNVVEFRENIQKNNGTIIDVRTPLEFLKGHIKGAVNMDLSSFDFQKQFSKLPKDQNYYLYCRSGSRSAVATSKMMVQRGYKNVSHLEGGFTSWDGTLAN